jgi:hypothetical protein
MDYMVGPSPICSIPNANVVLGDYLQNEGHNLKKKCNALLQVNTYTYINMLKRL